MQIETLKIKGIGPFQGEFEIPAHELDEIVAVTGHNGAGKTFLLECIPGVLYGYFPFRMYKQAGITIYDMVTPGLEAFIEMVFVVGGRRFKIERHIEIRGTWKGNTFKESSKSQNVVIQEDVGGEWIPRAEKTKAVNDYVEREICPQQLFLASAFNSQNSAGDIVDCGADERKQIFANIIGLSDLQGKAELFSARANFLSTLINNQETLRDSEISRVVDEEYLNREIETARANVAECGNERESLESAKEILLEQKARFDTIKDDMISTISKRNELTLSLENKKADADKFTRMIAARKSIESKVAELQSEKSKLETLQNNLENLNQRLNSKHSIDEKLSAIKLNIQKALTELQGERASADSDVATMKRRADKARVELNQALAKSEDAGLLDALDCEKNCRFVSKALEAQTWLVENPIERFEQILDGRIFDVNEHSKKLMEIEKRIAAKEYEIPFTQEVKELEAELLTFSPIETERDSVLSEIKICKSKITMLESNRVEHKLAQIEMAEQQLPQLENEISGIESAIAEAMQKYNALVLKSGDNPSDRIGDINRRLAGLDELIKGSERTIIQNEQKISVNAQSKFKAKMHDAMILKYQRLRASYERLKESFGRSGIQALVIDSEKLQFLDIARELFEILSGGKMALYFQTQKVLKSGDVREDFDLNLTVEGVTRRLEQCSQGQQDLGRMVMRATLGIYHAVKSGSRIQTYFLDETTGGLDEINRENYFEFLKYLLNYFKQIYVISHQDVARIIPCRVQITDDHKVVI